MSHRLSCPKYRPPQAGAAQLDLIAVNNKTTSIIVLHEPYKSYTMFAVTRALRASSVANVANAAKEAVKESGSGSNAVLKKGAKRDPELYVW